MLKKGAALLSGAAAGMLNGFFGTGGGLVAVPALEKGGLSVKEAHATALVLTASLSVASVLLYLGGGRFSLGDATGFLPGGVLGAAAGALLFRKLPARLLRKALGAFMIYFAVRTLLR